MNNVDKGELMDLLSNYNLLLDKWIEAHGLLTSWDRDAGEEIERIEKACVLLEE